MPFQPIQRLALAGSILLAVTGVGTAQTTASDPLVEAQAKLDQALSYAPMVESNGMRGQLLFVKASDIADFMQPSRRTPLVTEAKMGDEFHLRFVLFGAGTDENDKTDLVYDAALFGPDGKVIPAVTRKNLRAGSLPPFDLIAQPIDALSLGFEESDPIGFYRAEVIVHDRVADRTITLTSKIELKK